jgi:hypothetical protein
MRSIGYGEGLYPRARGESPSPEIHYANFDLSPQAPQAGRGEPSVWHARRQAASYTASHVNPSPLRRILPDDGEGKCAVQHSVSVSQ